MIAIRMMCGRVVAAWLFTAFVMYVLVFVLVAHLLLVFHSPFSVLALLLVVSVVLTLCLVISDLFALVAMMLALLLFVVVFVLFLPSLVT